MTRKETDKKNIKAIVESGEVMGYYHPDYFKKNGSLGGHARKKNQTKERLSEIGKMGATAREAKKIKE